MVIFLVAKSHLSLKYHSFTFGRSDMYIERWMVSVVPCKLKFITILVALVLHCEFSVVQKLHTSISLRTVNLIEVTTPLNTKTTEPSHYNNLYYSQKQCVGQQSLFVNCPDAFCVHCWLWHCHLKFLYSLLAMITKLGCSIIDTGTIHNAILFIDTSKMLDTTRLIL